MEILSLICFCTYPHTCSQLKQIPTLNAPDLQRFSFVAAKKKNQRGTSLLNRTATMMIQVMTPKKLGGLNGCLRPLWPSNLSFWRLCAWAVCMSLNVAIIWIIISGLLAPSYILRDDLLYKLHGFANRYKYFKYIFVYIKVLKLLLLALKGFLLLWALHILFLRLFLDYISFIVVYES